MRVCQPTDLVLLPYDAKQQALPLGPHDATCELMILQTPTMDCSWRQSNKSSLLHRAKKHRVL